MVLHMIMKRMTICAIFPNVYQQTIFTRYLKTIPRYGVFMRKKRHKNSVIGKTIGRNWCFSNSMKLLCKKVFLQLVTFACALTLCHNNEQENNILFCSEKVNKFFNYLWKLYLTFLLESISTKIWTLLQPATTIIIQKITFFLLKKFTLHYINRRLI